MYAALVEVIEHVHEVAQVGVLVSVQLRANEDEPRSCHAARS
jgi:hypothetical protein